MKYAFTDGVRQALARAREEAFRLRHDYVGTEHLLLGLIPDSGGAAAVLDRLGVDGVVMREQIERSVRPGKATRPGERPSRRGALPYTSRAKKALELSMDEARGMEDAYVGTEHLLLGLVREEKGIAAEVLVSLGVTHEQAWEATLDLLRSPAVLHRPAPGGGRPTDRFRVQIDDSSSSSIYEQIVAQVREAVATGALRARARLPSVRQLADELDIAPGTVARAYGELERLCVVVTEGARGTRVSEPRREAPPEAERRETLVGLLRPVAVAAFHMGATAAELRDALEPAMEGIMKGRDDASGSSDASSGSSDASGSSDIGERPFFG